ncbi:MAG: 2-oxoglutarate dehydrogenase complex dihydrolipoyllysine-residue succinyltransferase [Vicinamibacterales bacterium]
MATNIVVPELGESVVEARVAKWIKREGDRVSAGDPLVELETEKIDLEVSADRAGVLTSIRHGEGADVKVGEVLAILDEAGAAAPAEVAPSQAAETGEVSPKQAAESGGAAQPQPAKAGAAATTEKRATPTARNVAREQNVALDGVAGSGPGGRVMKGDVLKAGSATQPAAAKAPAPAAPAPKPVPPRPDGDRAETRERMTKRRQTIARRLVEAQHTAAMLTTFNEVDMTAVMALRARRKEAFQKAHGVGLGIASFFVKAAIGALKAFPAINAEIQGDEIVHKHYYDIGMAVGAEGGLVVPVIRNAEQLSVAEIELAIRDFSKRANDGSLTLDDLKGGTFTITNGGVFGSLMSTPILNPPQVGILGLHKIADRAVPVDGQVVIRPMMYLALSYDHRIVDGREAVQFLVRVKEFIEDPAFMMLEG